MRSAIAVFVVVTFGLFWRPLLGLGDWLPKDLVDRFPPWASEAPQGLTVHNRMLQDVNDNFVDHTFFFDEARHGRFATWDPYLVSGQPYAGKPVFFPLNVVFLLFPAAYAFGLLAALKTFLAMLFMYLFLKQLGVRHWASALGGVAFGLSAFQIVWLGWPQTEVTMLIPALFWTAERLIESPRATRACALAAVWGAMLLGGFPPLAGMAVYALAPYVLLRLWMTRGRRTAVRSILFMGGGFVAGTALAGIFLVPFADFVRDLDLSYREAYGTRTLLPMYLLTALVPNAFGTHVAPETWWGPEWNYVEVQIYAGVATLVFAASSLLLARRRSRAEGPSIAFSLFFLGAALVSLMLAFGVPGFLGGIVSRLPVFSTNSPARMRAIYCVAIAAAAGLGAHAWSEFLSDALPRRRFRRAALAGVAALIPAAGLAVLLAVGPANRYVQSVRERGYTRYIVEQFGYAAIFGVATILLLAYAVLRRPKPERVLVPAIGLLAVDLLLFASPFWTISPPDDLIPSTPAHAALASAVGDDRFLGLNWAFAPNSARASQLRDAHGHVFYSRDYRTVLRAVDPTAFEPAHQPTLPYFATDTINVRSPWLDRLSIRVLAADPRATTIGLRREQGPDPRATEDIPLAGQAERVVPRLAHPLAGAELFVSEAPVPGARITVSLIEPDGTVVAETTRRPFEFARGWNRWVLPTTRIDAAGYRLRVTTSHEVSFRWSGNAPDVAYLSPESDALTPVFGDGAVLYLRRTALPRARFASDWHVEKADLAALASRPATAPVSLERDPGIAATPGARGSATIAFDGSDEVHVRVSAAAGGLLVLGDAYDDGWEATVDGRPAPVLRADGILRAVPVGAGEHVVVMRFRPRSVKAGAASSILAAVVIGGVPLAARRRRRRLESATGAEPLAGPPPQG